MTTTLLIEDRVASGIWDTAAGLRAACRPAISSSASAAADEPGPQARTLQHRNKVIADGHLRLIVVFMQGLVRDSKVLVLATFAVASLRGSPRTRQITQLRRGRADFRLFFLDLRQALRVATA
jgi:hypothetical protein